MSRGVRIFRVDNPHTKPVEFWERLIAAINATDPDVIFLAEAFTRPAMMRALGEVGFQQSYTYFTWRNTKQELTDYLNELSGYASPYMRPNFFVNTPDILPEYLQLGGPNAFAIRALLASTLSPTWGVYAGFELYEYVALKAGGEEYLDSEKYEYRPRDWAAADARGTTLAPFITKLNSIRAEHPALQQLRNITFHRTDSDAVLCYSKRQGDDIVIVLVTVDPAIPRESGVHFTMPELGMGWQDTFSVVDELSGESFNLQEHNTFTLDPHSRCGYVFTIRKA
jgi:starch synthase (maltosyl-transferring)